MLLRTLGGLALEGSALTRPKPLVVLAYLALEGPTPRRRLAELFFGDAVDPRDSLSTALRHLRSAAAIDEPPGDDRIVSGVPSDAMRLLRSFDAYRYDEVVAAYKGPFLDGLEAELGVEAEEWAFSTRESIAGRVRAAALHRARSALRASRLDDARLAASLACTLVEASDLEEDELGVLLALADTLAMPETARLRALARAMGIAVSRGQELGAIPSAGNWSLHRTTRFIGRDEERHRIDGLLRDPDQRLIVVCGLGGIGKTRLLTRVADSIVRQHAARFPDRVTVVSLDEVRDASAAVSAIAAAALFGGSAGASVAGLAQSLAVHRCALVLDNVEQIDGIEAVLSTLLAACPHVVVLASSRRRLALQAAHHVELDGLRTDGPLGGSEAAALFLDRAARAGGGAIEAEGDLRTVDAICTALDGHPLAVELAAAMTRAVSLATLSEAIRGSVSDLAVEAIDVPRRHHTVDALLSPTWERLGVEDRSALVRLATFRSAFTYEAASDVGELGLRRLTRLVDVAVVRSEGGGRGRYRLHPLVRAYAREKASPDAWRAARDAHRRYVEGALARMEDDLELDAASVLDRLAALREDVRVAVEHALAVGDTASAGAMLHTVVVSADLLQARGGDADLVRLVVDTARAVERSGDLQVAERLMTKAANATRTLLDDRAGCVELYREALAFAERSGDTVRRAALQSILAFLLLDGEPDASAAHLARAVELAESSGDTLAMCEVAGRVVYCSARANDWETARRVGYEVQGMLEDLYRTRAAPRSRLDSMQYMCLHNLATAEDELGNKQRALEHRLRALVLAEQVGNVLHQAHAHADLARAFHDSGAFELATEHFTEAAQRFREVGVREPLEALQRDLGLPVGREGAFEASRRHHGRRGIG